MIGAKKFTEVLIKNNLGPVVEVPCSYFKDFMNYLWDLKVIEVINPVNEAVAMGIASGYYLSTGKIPIVAIQNSGFMSTINALTSLNQIYCIPVFYFITWRGKGGEGSDAPEHDITGANMEKILKTFHLPYEIIDIDQYSKQIKKLATIALKTQKPVALILRKNTFKKYIPLSKQQNNKYEMTRYEVLEIIKNNFDNNALFISTTGFLSRDSFVAKDTPDFYMVGSMGHAFSLALGIGPNTKKKVVILDGDGSALMHLGGLASFIPEKHKNIQYIVLDNEIYESTGAQPTMSTNVDFSSLAKAFKFKNYKKVVTKFELRNALKRVSSENKPFFIHIKITNGLHAESKRVSDIYSCPQIKKRFMETVK